MAASGIRSMVRDGHFRSALVGKVVHRARVELAASRFITPGTSPTMLPMLDEVLPTADPNVKSLANWQ
jgi:hypothetical protein